MPSAVLSEVEVLAFDVFGTVVDWRSSVVRALEQLGREKGLARDWPIFADRWRHGYIEGILRVNAGQEAWSNVDEIHRRSLLALLREFQVPELEPAEVERLNRVWHYLDPWPDAVPGLTRLRSRRLLTTLSNGHLSLLVTLAKSAGLPWDCVLSAEMVGRYKPDPEVYRFAARILDRAPERIAMVAAHPPDLHAARVAGLRTIFVERPFEYGTGRPPSSPRRRANSISTQTISRTWRFGSKGEAAERHGLVCRSHSPVTWAAC